MHVTKKNLTETKVKLTLTADTALIEAEKK